MIRYFDSSAIVKRYVAEAGHDRVLRWYSEAPACATASVACAETLAALGRRHRSGLLTLAEWDLIERGFLRDWSRHLIVALTNDVLAACRSLIRNHTLRGFDAIHLASALAIKERSGEEVRFVCADKPLASAGREIGLTVENPTA